MLSGVSCVVASAIIHGFGLVHLPCPKNGISGISRFSEGREVHEQERHRQCHQNEPHTQVFAHTSLLFDQFFGGSIIRLRQVSFSRTGLSVTGNAVAVKTSTSSPRRAKSKLLGTHPIWLRLRRSGLVL